ncbi:DUF6319 family protein [Rhodococcus kronopolitis]|uniref:DUF6319 family protein n=1 Tax=Rhodococcus kronopolitis TaxID=1460226 RepID=A0ABV9FRZ8_9NOCA
MPPRKNSVDRLTEQDLTELAAAVAAGKRATVYLNDATPSLGLAAGCSARVLSIDGGTVLIRPKGVNDELPFEADELRRTQNSAKSPAKPAAAKAASRSVTPRQPKPVPAKAIEPRPAPAATAAPRTPTTAPVAVPASVTPPKAAVTAPKTEPVSQAPEKPAPASRRARRPKDATSVSVTLHAEAANEWTVTVTHGERRPSKAVPVAADAVERAVRELGDPVAEQAVAAVLSAARDAAARRVRELSEQLAEARTTLEALGADVPETQARRSA